MDRLTTKINENRRKYRVLTIEDKVDPGTYFAEDFCIRNDEAIDKLGQYEDIDEELGLPYPIFFKAFFNGVNYLDASGQIIRTLVSIYDLYLTERKKIAFITQYENKILLFEDYAKTWALTREELS